MDEDAEVPEMTWEEALKGEFEKWLAERHKVVDPQLREVLWYTFVGGAEAHKGLQCYEQAGIWKVKS